MAGSNSTLRMTTLKMSLKYKDVTSGHVTGSFSTGDRHDQGEDSASFMVLAKQARFMTLTYGVGRNGIG